MTNETSIDVLIQTVIKQMNRLEVDTNCLMCDVSPDLEDWCVEAMDSRNACKLNKVIKYFDTLI